MRRSHTGLAAVWCHAGRLRQTGSDVVGGVQVTETAQSPCLGPGKRLCDLAWFICGFSPIISLKSVSIPYYRKNCMKWCL